MVIYDEECEIFRRTFKKFIENEIAPFIEEWEEKKRYCAHFGKS